MRVIEKKRPPFMTPKRWAWLAIAAAVTLLVWSGLYFREIMLPSWSETGAVRAAALQSGELAEVDHLYKHVWEEVVWVAEGKDSSGELVYLFMRDGETLHAASGSEAPDKQEMTDKFRQAKPDAELIRLMPGMYRNRPAWEAYYSQTVNGQKRFYYDFYTFDHEGGLTETYRLPAKTGP